MTSSRVFQTVRLERTKLRYHNLHEFGELVYLWDSVQYVHLWDEDLDKDILGRFRGKNFDPALDFFAVSGIMILANIALTTLVEEYGEIQTLMFDNETKQYRVRRVGSHVT